MLSLWDLQIVVFAGDNYVHRLIQNKGDGKLVEVDEGDNMVVENEKTDAIQLEVGSDFKQSACCKNRCTVLHSRNCCKCKSVFLQISYLVTKQLEEQKRFLDNKISKVEEEAQKRVRLLHSVHVLVSLR